MDLKSNIRRFETSCPERGRPECPQNIHNLRSFFSYVFLFFEKGAIGVPWALLFFNRKAYEKNTWRIEHVFSRFAKKVWKKARTIRTILGLLAWRKNDVRWRQKFRFMNLKSNIRRFETGPKTEIADRAKWASIPPRVFSITFDSFEKRCSWSKESLDQNPYVLIRRG